MSNGYFSPFETAVDRESALAILRNSTLGADDGELFFERRQSETLVLDDNRLKSANFDASEGFGLRAVHGDVTGYAHSTEISEAAMKRAASTVALAAQDIQSTMAVAPLSTNNNLYPAFDPTQEVSFAAKIDVLREIDAFVRDLDPRVIQVSAVISASCQEIVILRPEDDVLTDTRPMTRVNISVIVEENGRRETGTAGGGGRFALGQLIDPQDWQPKAKEALRVALVNLTAEPAPAGVMDVVLGPGWPGILLHEAIGHGLEGDFNRKGSSAFAGMMGQQIAATGVTVLDDGTLPNRRGSLNIDDEGTPSGKNTLIEDGVLVGYMRKLCTCSDATDDQHLYDGWRNRASRYCRRSQGWNLRSWIWRWSS